MVRRLLVRGPGLNIGRLKPDTNVDPPGGAANIHSQEQHCHQKHKPDKIVNPGKTQQPGIVQQRYDHHEYQSHDQSVKLAALG